MITKFQNVINDPPNPHPRASLWRITCRIRYVNDPLYFQTQTYVVEGSFPHLLQSFIVIKKEFFKWSNFVKPSNCGWCSPKFRYFWVIYKWFTWQNKTNQINGMSIFFSFFPFFCKDNSEQARVRATQWKILFNLDLKNPKKFTSRALKMLSNQIRYCKG